MSNLGLYQTMTTLAKKAGGPLQLGATVAVGGYVVIRTVEAVGRKVIKTVKKRSKSIALSRTYIVHTQGESNEGLIFNIGDEYRVLEVDKDCVLIEKIGDLNNPYFVSADLLHSISDFES